MIKIIARIIITTIAAGVVILAGCGKKETGMIKIGAILPLTGDLAIYGQKMKKGIDLAIEQKNKNGGIGGKKVFALYEDDIGDPKISISAFQKLVTFEKVPVVIGGAISRTAAPLIPIANQNRVVLFSPAATAPDLAGKSKYFFRNWPSDVFDGEAMAEFASKNLKIKKVAIFYVKNEWGTAISKIFSDEYKNLGGQISFIESYDQNSTDFRTQLLKINTSTPDAIFLPGYLKELILILTQKREMKIDCRILSAYGFFDPKILELPKDALEGAVFTAPFFDPDAQDTVIKMYNKSYQSVYDEIPDIWSAQSYDAANLILSVLSKGDRSGPQIQTGLANIKNYPGVSGLTSFDKNGEVVKPLRIMTVKEGKFINYSLSAQ